MALNSFGANASSSGYAIVPDDNNNLPQVIRGLYVGTAGNVVCILVDDTTPITFVGMVAGSVYPLLVKRILSTNTTAGSLIGLV